MNSGDGIAVGWLSRSIQDKGNNYSLRRMPLFETFPVVLLDKDGVGADLRSVVNQNTVLSRLVSITFYGGELDGVSFNNPAAVKKMLSSTMGEIFF
jgi:photosystem II CP47 chlorophyll apoprotein